MMSIRAEYRHLYRGEWLTVIGRGLSTYAKGQPCKIAIKLTIAHSDNNPRYIEDRNLRC